MKILQVVPSISLIYGGPSQMVLGLSAALARQGVEVTIVTTDSNGDVGQPPLDVPLGQPVSQDGYQIYYFRCFPFRRYKFSLGLCQWLWQHGTEFDLAHIHALFSPVSTLAAVLARVNALPYILRPLGTLDPADLRKKRWLKQVYVALLEGQNLAGAAAVHFTTEQEARVSERFGLSLSDVIIPLGVISSPPSIPFYDHTDAIPRILFLSRIEPKKGLDILLPALEEVLKTGMQFEFVLAGSNPQDPEYERQIHRQIAQSSLAPYTTITGFVAGEAKANLLATVDLFVLPSYYENFGIAVAEAMMAGVPVIISDQVHIWQEVQAADGGWVGTCDVESIASLIYEALKDPQNRCRRGINAQVYAQQHYHWDHIAQRMIHTYETILARSS